MDRRAFLGALAGGLLAAPLAAEAQQSPRVYRIGVVSAISELGYVEGQHFIFEARFAEGRTERLPELVAETIRLKGRRAGKQIRKSRKKHPEYTIALLIAVASEALSALRREEEHSVFAKELLDKYGVKEQVGRGLFQSVRHGLAHRYDTALVAVGQQSVVAVITWKRPDRHLRVPTMDWLKDGHRRPGVYLDMETLWRDLDSYLRMMTRRLRNERKFSRLVVRRSRWLDQKYTVRPMREESAAAWKQVWEDFLEERRLSP